MAKPDAVVVYDVVTLAILRAILCDHKSQVYDPHGPCALKTGEAALTIPRATFESYTNSKQIAEVVMDAAQALLP